MGDTAMFAGSVTALFETASWLALIYVRSPSQGHCATQGTKEAWASYFTVALFVNPFL